MSSQTTNDSQPSTSKLPPTKIESEKSNSQVYVITPNQLAKLGLSKQLMSILESQLNATNAALDKEKTLQSQKTSPKGETTSLEEFSVKVEDEDEVMVTVKEGKRENASDQHGFVKLEREGETKDEDVLPVKEVKSVNDSTQNECKSKAEDESAKDALGRSGDIKPLASSRSLLHMRSKLYNLLNSDIDKLGTYRKVIRKESAPIILNSQAEQKRFIIGRTDSCNNNLSLNSGQASGHLVLHTTPTLIKIPEPASRTIQKSDHTSKNIGGLRQGVDIAVKNEGDPDVEVIDGATSLTPESDSHKESSPQMKKPVEREWKHRVNLDLEDLIKQSRVSRAGPRSEEEIINLTEEPVEYPAIKAGVVSVLSKPVALSKPFAFIKSAALSKPAVCSAPHLKALVGKEEAIVRESASCAVSYPNVQDVINLTGTQPESSPLKTKLEIVSNEVVNFSPVEIQNFLKSNIPYFQASALAKREEISPKTVNTVITKTACLPKALGNNRDVTPNASTEKSCERQKECDQIIDLDDIPEDKAEKSGERSVKFARLPTLKNFGRKEESRNLFLIPKYVTPLERAKDVKVLFATSGKLQESDSKSVESPQVHKESAPKILHKPRIISYRRIRPNLLLADRVSRILQKDSAQQQVRTAATEQETDNKEKRTEANESLGEREIKPEKSEAETDDLDVVVVGEYRAEVAKGESSVSSGNSESVAEKDKDRAESEKRDTQEDTDRALNVKGIETDSFKITPNDKNRDQSEKRNVQESKEKAHYVEREETNSVKTILNDQVLKQAESEKRNLHLQDVPTTSFEITQKNNIREESGKGNKVQEVPIRVPKKRGRKKKSDLDAQTGEINLTEEENVLSEISNLRGVETTSDETALKNSGGEQREERHVQEVSILVKKRGRKKKSELNAQAQSTAELKFEDRCEDQSEERDVQKAQPRVPKKRGRKRKSELNAQNSAEPEFEDTYEERNVQLRVPKKRGRKKKSELDVHAQNSTEPEFEDTDEEERNVQEEQPRVPKKRGRKRKSELNEQAQNSAEFQSEATDEEQSEERIVQEEQPHVPKKRGRKRKSEISARVQNFPEPEFVEIASDKEEEQSEESDVQEVQPRIPKTRGREKKSEINAHVQNSAEPKFEDTDEEERSVERSVQEVLQPREPKKRGRKRKSELIAQAQNSAEPKFEDSDQAQSEESNVHEVQLHVPKKRGRKRKFELHTQALNYAESTFEDTDEKQREEGDVQEVEPLVPKRWGRKKKLEQNYAEPEFEDTDEAESEEREVQEVQPRVPKKRGRKKKSELIAQAQNTPKPEGTSSEVRSKRTSDDPNLYIQSRTSGRWRKFVDYNVLSGNTAQSEATELKVEEIPRKSREPKLEEAPRRAGEPKLEKPPLKARIQKKILSITRMSTDSVKAEAVTVECDVSVKESDCKEYAEKVSTKPHTEAVEQMDTSETESAPVPKKKRGRKRKAEVLDEEQPEEAQPNPSEGPELVTCAQCDSQMVKSDWSRHKEVKHNNLAWRTFDRPLDLTDQTLVTRILTKLCKLRKSLSCEFCGSAKKSLSGYLSHKAKCQDVLRSDADAERDQELNKRLSDKAKCQNDAEESSKSASNKKTFMSDVLDSLFSNIGPSRNGGDPLASNSVGTQSAPPETSNLSEDDSSTEEILPITNEAQCAVCKEVMKKGQWSSHKQKKHNNLAWRDGDTPLDLENRTLVMRILTDLYKSRKPLTCEMCGAVKKSVLGFLSHKSQCQKTENEIEALKVMCELCGRSMLPVSLQRHMVLSHKAPAETEILMVPGEIPEPSPPGKRKAANRAAGLIQDFVKDAFNEKSSTGFKKYVKNVNFRSVEAAIYKFSENIQKNSYAECVFNECEFRTSEHEDLFHHIETCPKSAVTNYSCNFCLTTFRTRRGVQEHIRACHGNSKNGAIILEFSSDHEVVSDAEDDDDEQSDGMYESDSEFAATASGIKGSHFFDMDVFNNVQSHRKTQSTGKGTTPATRRIQWLPKKNKAPNCLYRNAYWWTQKFYQENYLPHNNFPGMYVRKDDWAQLDPKYLLSYLPKLRYSVDSARIRVNAIVNPSEYDYKWKKYKLFESDVSTEDGTSTIFCGGPVNAMAWVPTPHPEPHCDQILAVSVLPDPDEMYNTNVVYKGGGLIQFWNFGVLTNNQIPTRHPKLEFCLAHHHGIVWSIEWCPSGFYDLLEQQELENVKKLGLLAVTCSDRFVFIYTVLHPGQLSGTVFKAKPTFRLQLENFEDLSVGEIKYYSTKLSWSKVVGHQFLAVGYSNGMVGIYDLGSTASLLRTEEDGVIVLRPVQKFRPHLDAITALVLHHMDTGRRWLLTGSLDRDCKLWDLENISEPLNSCKKFIITDAVWLLHWLCSIYSFDHGCITGAVPTSVNPARDFYASCTSFMPSSSRVTSLAGNDWGNLFIQANDCGEVICGFPDQLLQGYDCDKRKSIRRARCITSYTGMIAKQMAPADRAKIESTRVEALKNQISKLSMGKSSKKQMMQNYDNDAIRCEPRTYPEVREKYGLVFCDLIVDYKLKEPSQELDKLLSSTHYFSLAKPDVYPLQSITKVASNPNKESFLYYACGYQVGFVRVANIRFLCPETD